ncbi:MAG: hypothetical protein QOF57_1843 [Frankiaceae bacterium]|nr:hypothetical protein [Frankiaceae bacterium]
MSIAAARTMGGKWYVVSLARFRSAPYAFLFTRSSLIAAIGVEAGRTTKVTFATLGGRRVLALRVRGGHVLYASATGSPRPLRFSSGRSYSFAYGVSPVIDVPTPVHRIP